MFKRCFSFQYFDLAVGRQLLDPKRNFLWFLQQEAPWIYWPQLTKGGEGDTALFLNWWRTLISVVGFWVISVMRHFESGWGIELPVCCHEASLSAKELQQLRWSTERLLYGSLDGLFVAAKSARSVWVLVFVIRNPRLVNPLKIILSTPDNWQLLGLSYLCSDPCGTGCIWLK